MSTSHASGDVAVTTRRPRARFALAAVVLLLAVTASCVMLGIIGSRWSARLDVTASREHELAPRTQAVLDSIATPLRLIVAADLGSLEPDGWKRTLDVLAKFQGASPRLTITTIDTGAPEGLAAYDGLLADLATAHKPALERHTAVVANASDQAEASIGALSEISTGLMSIRDDLAAAPLSDQAKEALRRYFDGEAAKCRGYGDDLKKAAGESRQRLAELPSAFPVPPVDSIARGLAVPLGQLASGLGVLGSSLDRFTRTEGVPASARDRAETLIRTLSALRDRLARAASELEGLGTLPIITVARTIQRSRAVLLVAEPSANDASDANAIGAGRRPTVSAIDAEAFLPRPRGTAGPAIDRRARVEEMITAGVASFSAQPRPLAVFVHAGPARFGPSLGPWARVSARLGLRGIECIEWAAAIDDQPPAAAIEARGVSGATARPIVFAVFGMEIRRPEDAARLSRVTSALRQLVETGRNVLVCPAPSNLPASGEHDPFVEPLAALGIACDTGRLLMDEARVMGPQGAQRMVLTGVELLEPGATHPISGAVMGLRTTLPLAAMPLSALAEPPTGVTVSPVLVLPGRDTLWAESEWLAFHQTPPDQRGAFTSLPSPDSARDVKSGPAGSSGWLLAAAIERSSPSLPARQRAVVVGSLPWSFDVFADAAVASEGRAGLAAPGNVELLHASIAWLAGREDLIARGAEAASLPTIPALSVARVSVLRWALVGGLPLAVLLLGALWRMARG